MGQYKAMTAPYSVWMAPPMATIFDPGEITDRPADPWVQIEDGANEAGARIEQSPVVVTWEKAEEEEEPDINSTYSERVYVTKRSCAVRWSMKNVGVQHIAKLLDGLTLTEVARSASAHQSVEFELGEQDMRLFSLLLLGYNQQTPNGPKLPSIGYLANAYVSGSIERATSRTSPTMIEVTMRALKAPNGDVGTFKDILQEKGTG